jgi:hypothetical protein
MDRLRIEAAVAATTDTAKTLKAVMADPDFPRSARAQAMHIAQYELNGVSPELRQDLFANGMDSGAGRDCELASMANELIELNGDPAGGAALIEKYLHESGACMATATVRALLAEAYLLEAAKIAPQPTRGNAKLIRQAKGDAGSCWWPLPNESRTVSSFCGACWSAAHAWKGSNRALIRATATATRSFTRY